MPRPLFGQQTHPPARCNDQLTSAFSNLLANMLQIQQSEGYTPRDSLVGVLPMWHIYALQLLLCVSPYVFHSSLLFHS
jgi:hypothetical protein